MTSENKAADDKPMSDDNLDDVFSSNDDAKVEVEAQPTKTQTAEAEPQGEEVTDDAETPAAKDSEDKLVPVAALQSERRKRQELEAKIAQYEKNPPVEPVKRPDILEDQEGAFQHTESQFAQALLQERINLSRELMIDKHADYEAVEATFVEMAGKNPQLVQEMNRSSNPAKFAYNKAKEQTEYTEFQKVKETEEYKEFLAAKKAGKLEKPVEETPAQKRNKAALAMPSLNRATSVSSNTVQKAQLPSLDEMFGD